MADRKLEETERELEAMGYLEANKGEKDKWRTRVKSYNGLQWATQKGYLESLIDFIRPEKQDVILEIGTGTGIVANALGEKCEKVIAIDNSESMVKGFKSERKNVEGHLGDARALMFPDNSFDKVVARMALHHIMVDLDKVFREANRVLKPYGVFIISEGVPPSNEEEVVKDYGEIFKLKEERRIFTEEMLKEMLKPLFREVEAEYFWQKGMSFRNWLEGDSHLSKEQREKIFEFRKNSGSKVKKAYNLREKGNDLIVDFRMLNIKARPKKGFAIWLTGMSGSGKSTVAENVKEKLEAKGLQVQIIDGDLLRKRFKGENAYSKESFSKQAILEGNKLAVNLAKEEMEKGKAVLIAIIAPFKEARNYARKELENYSEVFLKCPKEVCAKRGNAVSLYKRLNARNDVQIFGENRPYDVPKKPELELNTDVESVEESAEKLLAMRSKKGFGEAFNIGEGKRISVLQLLEKINKSLGKDIKPKFAPARKGEAMHLQAEISKAKKMLGYRVKGNFDSGLEKTIEWFKERK